MEIYLLVEHNVIDMNDCGIAVRSYYDINDARKALEESVKNLIIDKSWITNRGQDYFSAYEKYRYMENHIDFEIIPTIVK